MKLESIHPFPARMAPEIVIRQLRRLRPGSVVLDPMSGSGTVLRAASEMGFRAIGFDIDPLAVLMARVWTRGKHDRRIEAQAKKIVVAARKLKDFELPWLDRDPETRTYVRFWFRPKQIRQLRRLAHVLHQMRGSRAELFRLALSRIIITKERGASVARDTSHSRPHRVFFENDFDVYRGFLNSVKRISSRLKPHKVSGKVTVCRGDARALLRIPTGSIDAVVTSPPYLNAIDYLRGHRLALVWLGYDVSKVRKVRSRSIGSERKLAAAASSVADGLLLEAGQTGTLSPRHSGMVRRYAADVHDFLKELFRVLKPGGRLLLVVGDSRLQGTHIPNARINLAAARKIGFSFVRKSDRRLPAGSRYLPISHRGRSKSLTLRMKTETLLQFRAGSRAV